MAKLKAGRLRREVTDACLQFWGGMGFTWDNPVARTIRDGRLGSIGGGADEVMLHHRQADGHPAPARQSLTEVKKMGCHPRAKARDLLLGAAKGPSLRSG